MSFRAIRRALAVRGAQCNYVPQVNEYRQGMMVTALSGEKPAMSPVSRRAAQIAVVMLLSVVVTQIIYIGLSNAGLDINRPVIWTVETVAFLALGVAGMVALARGTTHPAAWAAIALGGALNVIQVGMGLAMFPPLQDAGAAMKPAFDAMLAGAFFLYFAGKALFGFAAIDIGLGIMRRTSGMARAIGVLAMLGGLVGLVANVLAIGIGMDMVFIAGATGTVASLLLALAIILQLKK